MLRSGRSSLGQIRDLGLVGIVLVATSSLSHPAAGQGQGPTLDRPPTQSVGDTFTFTWSGRNVVRTYIGQKDSLDCYTEKAANGQQSEACFTSSDCNLVRRVGTLDPVEFTPHNGRHSFPLFVGKQWEVSYTLADVDARTIIAKVVSYEKVTVPAGTFDAFKIEARTSAGMHQSRGREIVEYYSPKLGLIKVDSDQPMVLISYSLAKPRA
jgi:hypothetical protein